MPEKVDVIVSEPLGFLLVHERMLETFLDARDRFLKPGGLMMPTTGDIFLAPFSDSALWEEQRSKASFWDNTAFHGIDLSPLKEDASAEYFGQVNVARARLSTSKPA